MFNSLSRVLAREQHAFLSRDRQEWWNHLARIQDFLGEGLNQANPARPVLILGAGSGLEIPWKQAPKGTTGWDADPFSRVRTLLRHRRWAPWVFGDLTDAFEPLRLAAERSVQESWSGRRRRLDIAQVRLAALLPSLPVAPIALRRWIHTHRPGTILAANVMGQLAPLAQRVLERAFAPEAPWEADAEVPDRLHEALERWAERVIRSLLKVLEESGAELWLVHDRAVLETASALELGPFTLDWKAQVKGAPRLEAWDPLCSVEVVAELATRTSLRQERWFWPVGEAQHHLVEALAFATKTP